MSQDYITQAAGSLVSETIPIKQVAKPQPTGIFRGQPTYGYGMRYVDPNRPEPVTPKATGYYGPISTGSPDVMTEVGGGNEVGERPSIVPTLSKPQLQKVAMAMENPAYKFPQDVTRKADIHADYRALQGKSVWSGPQDKAVLPPAGDEEIRGYSNIAGVTKPWETK